MKKTVVIGVTSGIAAYKILELIRMLRKDGHEVFVIMTAHATQMVSPAEFEKASGHNVFSQLFEKDFDYKKILNQRSVDHIDLADKADLFVIAPATANTIAKLASGIADDFLTTTALAVTAPIIICPSMNVNMWNNPVTQENSGKLRKRGYLIVEPETGMLACGYIGAGRLASIPTIKKEIDRQLSYHTSLVGKTVLVTAGGTMEKIDAVRFITNRSSGKMGVAIAEECYRRGAKVLLLRAKNAVTSRYPIDEEVFTTADDLSSLIKKHIKKYQWCYHAAAVSDFSVKNSSTEKLSSEQATTIHLQPRTKILDSIKQWNKAVYLVAFKAEALSQKGLIQAAQKRLEESHADVIVANDISKADRGFEVDTNAVSLIFADGTIKHLPLNTKHEIAKQIVDALPLQ